MAETLEEWYAILQDTVDKYTVLIETEQNEKLIQKYKETQTHYKYYLDLKNTSSCTETACETVCEQEHHTDTSCETACDKNSCCSLV
jgi:galactokinase/mevalonate kinase-like predicted kinase